MKKILAVSGGVDSMLLMYHFRDDKDAVVAHFNHGTRKSADDDAKLVRRMALEYGLEFFDKKAELGPDVSEAEARKARYDFLYEMVDKYDGDAKIYTAHHLNDLAETIAINLVRGTGWRGLAPFSDTKVVRPFIAEKMTKADILAEAAKEGIIYRQDPTNTEDNYLRNRLREKVFLLGRDELLKIAELYEKQVVLRSEIEEICESIASEMRDDNKYPREIFRDLDDNVAMEILREVCAANNISLTRPQLHDLLIAVREYLPGKKFNLPKDRFVEIRKSWFAF